MTDLDATLAALPVEYFATLLRALDDADLLAPFCDWFDVQTYDPGKTLDRGTFSFMVLTTINEMQMYDSDPGEVLRCVRDALRIELGGAGSPIPLPDRLAALRPPEGDE
jgi:hypothetical protein